MSDLSKRIAALPAKKYELLLRRLNREQEAAAPLQLVPQPRDTNIFPLSFAQQRMWLLAQFEPDNSLYTIPSAMHLLGALDLRALEASLDALVQRHAILRTTFPTSADGLPCQVIAPTLALALPLIDLQDRPTVEREAEAQRLIAAESKRVFDLMRGPLLRTTLLRLSSTSHILLISIHHIIADGWSISVLMGDLSALYVATLDGAPDPLPPLTLQYADYAVWQRQRIEAGALEGQRAYWQAQLAGAPVLQLPSDHARPAIQTYRSASLPLTLSAELTARLGALNQQAGTTLFMTLAAVFTTFLSRLSGQTDFCVGALVAGRNHPDLESLIGFFVNNLALRADLSGDPTTRELLERVRTVTLDAYMNQDLPFEQVLAALQIDRIASHPPLFQAMCVLQNVPRSRQVLPGLTLRPLLTASRRSGFDLTLWLWEGGAQLTGELEYNPHLFEPTTVARLARHLRTLLTGLAENPERRIGSLSLLSETERQQILVEWNETDREFRSSGLEARSVPAGSWLLAPESSCLHTLVEAQAARTPDAVALVFDATNDHQPATDTYSVAHTTHYGTQHLTYAALNTRANQLAHHLGELGVEPEALVAIGMERSLELVVGLLGVLKAGGAYVPIDPSYPPARRAFMLKDSGAAALLVATADDRRPTTDDRAASPFVQPQVLDLIADWPAIAQSPTTRPDSGVAPESLAYAIYTSGSTGQPKGVMNSHRGICNRLRWMQETYRLDETDGVLQKTPISFDVSVWEFFWPLMSGARLVLARPGGQQDSTYLARLIARSQITTLHFVPSMLRVFLAERDLRPCHSLRRVISSGEALPAELQDRFYSRLDAELHNLYGPTEAAIDVTAWACEREKAQRSVPIGRPIANTQTYVLDRNLMPVPIGVAGELYLGGVQLARGYLGRPDLTAERFVPNPFGEVSGTGYRVSGVGISDTRYPAPDTRLYKTGDLARWRADGMIEYLGRVDQQIKLRGFRIELGEVEAAIGQHRAVREVAVLLRDDDAGGRLVAYVVTTKDERRKTKEEERDPSFVLRPSSFVPELRAFLKEKLPDYMLPAAFVVLDALPLTPSGKVDRRALPLTDQVRPAREREFVAPRTPGEDLLAEIWAQVLGVKQVGVHDNFFDLGGHSLLVVQLMFRLRDEWQIDLPLHILFEQPTIAELALTVEELLLDEVADLSEEEALEQIASTDEIV